MKIAFISDIHGNLEAFDAVLKDIKSQRAAKIICCGDVAGYGASPNECCYIVESMKIPTVMGNHDFACLDLKDIGKFNKHAQEALHWTNKTLLKEHKEFLKKLPKHYGEQAGEFKIYVMHGSPDDELYDYVMPSRPNSELQAFLAKTNSDILVVGHSHIPFVKRFGRKLVINAGSVGQPRDNRPEASYAILNPETLAVEIRRVSYDIEKAAKRIILAKLPRFLADRLFEGR